ncbi:MAG: ABC transporter ATP-binding protein [Bacteroidetes bacterium]|nr:MAG: ABC transporter ATP-binding protein [Bacteroidota bacterium]
MIEVKNITKTFNGKNILDDISAEFYPGKTNLIIGGSGQGKTVLMKCMVGLHEINTGSILYDNRDFSMMDFKERKNIRKEIGMLFQNAALFDSLNVQENVSFPLRMFADMNHGEIMDRVDFCLERVHLEDVHTKYPAELSGGMKKRVGIARAIAMNPMYLFCDEPNSGLDPKTAVVIDNLIKEITEEFNTTTVVNTHDMNSVMEIGDQVIFIHQGKKWWEGTNKEILESDNEELSNFLFASSFLQEMRK